MPISENIRHALNLYNGEMDSLNTLIQAIFSEFGSNWRAQMITLRSELSSNNLSKIDHAIHYYDALNAWTTVQTYLAQNEPLDSNYIQSQLSDLTQAISFFGDPGVQAITQLKEKMALQSSKTTPQFSDLATSLQENTVVAEDQPASLEPETDDTFFIQETNTDTSLSVENELEKQELSDVTATIEGQGISVTEETPKDQTSDDFQTDEKSFASETQVSSDTPVVTETKPYISTQVQEERENPIWAVEKVLKQVALTQDVQAWVAARCIDLGNIEVFTYPYYHFVVDLMQQTLKGIQDILSDTTLLEAMEVSYSNEKERLKHIESSLQKDLEVAYQNTDSDETPLTRESLNSADLKKMFGQLDTSDQDEYLGPAPDGFEMISDPYETSNSRPTSNNNQVENPSVSTTPTKNFEGNMPNTQKMSSQMAQNGVKRNLSFSLGSKQNKPTDN